MLSIQARARVRFENLTAASPDSKTPKALMYERRTQLLDACAYNFTALGARYMTELAAGMLIDAQLASGETEPSISPIEVANFTVALCLGNDWVAETLVADAHEAIFRLRDVVYQQSA